MGMIFFAGLLDNGLGFNNAAPYPGYENPISIRGYDEAGNLLSKIRVSNPIPIVDVEYVPALDYPANPHRYYFYFNAKDRSGEGVLAYVNITDYQAGYGETPPWIASIPSRIVATPDGEVFCFCVLATPNGENKAYVDGTLQTAFVDPFRIYNRDGYQMPSPEILAEPTCMDVDQDGNVYLGGFARNSTGGAALDSFSSSGQWYPGTAANAYGMGSHVFRKYNRDGDLLWSIPGYYFVYWRSQVGGIWYEGLDQNARDGITALAWDSAGYLYVAGITGYIPGTLPNAATPSSSRWAPCYGSQCRVRKIDPDDGTVIWDEFFSHVPIDDWASLTPLSLIVNLVINDDVLYLVYYSHLYQIGTDGITIDHVALSPASGDSETAVIPQRDLTYLKNGVLYVETNRTTSQNPLNLQRYDPDDLSFLGREETLGQGWRQAVFNDTQYIGARELIAIPGSIYSYHMWHYRTKDAADTAVWAAADMGTPGLHGQVASDTDGTHITTGAPWPDQYSATPAEYPSGITWKTYYELYLRYTDVYGRAVGPDWGGDVNNWGGWIARDVRSVADTTIPSLAVPIALGLPDYLGDLYVDAPAFPLRLLLGLPFYRRDYVGRPLPIVHRVTVGSLELPLISLTARYKAAELTIEVIAGFTGLAQIDALIAADGETLTLWRGPRFADDSEQLEPMIAAPLTGNRLDWGGNSARIMLTARQATPSLVYRSRTLTGISWIGDGRLRCAVDTFLRPGDTALFDAESWTVASLEYTITAQDAVMQVERE